MQPVREKNIEIIRLEDSRNDIFKKVVEWNYEWWGKKSGKSVEAIYYLFEHSICKDRLPQTFVALVDGEPAGMYQLSMSDDLFGRPDIYPWLINVYVDESFRGRQICRKLMETVSDRAKDAGINKLYLYTSHVGLYEKFGWEFTEEVKTFNESSPIERLYHLEIN